MSSNSDEVSLMLIASNTSYLTPVASIISRLRNLLDLMAEGAGSANIAGEVSIISGKPREIRPLLDTSVTTGLIESSGSNARGALSSLKLGKGCC